MSDALTTVQNVCACFGRGDVPGLLAQLAPDVRRARRGAARPPGADAKRWSPTTPCSGPGQMMPATRSAVQALLH